jgi:hypothetical protein
MLRAPGGVKLNKDVVNLKQYIDAMGPQARAQAARIVSIEANEVLQLHVSSLFVGDSGRVLTSLGQFRRKHPHRASSSFSSFLSSSTTTTATPSIPTADDEDDLVSLHVNQLKHIVLEACAFGAALAKTECAIDSEFGVDAPPLLTRN